MKSVAQSLRQAGLKVNPWYAKYSTIFPEVCTTYFNPHFHFLEPTTISGVEPRMKNFLLSIMLLGWKPRTWFEGDHQPIISQSDLIRKSLLGNQVKDDPQFVRVYTNPDLFH